MRCEHSTYLVDGVKEVNAIFVPTQHPAFLEEARNEPQVFLGQAATSPVGGLQTRVQLERRDSSSKDVFKDERGLHRPVDVSLPQPEPRPRCIQGQVALLTKSWYKTSPEFPSAEITREQKRRRKAETDYLK